jgi:uroporphyrinogen decarboxylase
LEGFSLSTLDVTGSKPVLHVLSGKRSQRIPIWLMRQAGRYLPEYRQIRSMAASFLDFCYTPKLAIEATLQPLRRFDFDAAILFSDILVIPDALGQPVSFESGEGPRLPPLSNAADFSSLKTDLDLVRLAPIFETVAGVKAALPKGVALIGFCGAPWTVASYMVAGKGTADQAPARLLAYRDPALFTRLIDRLVDASILYLLEQIRAGVEVVQIFDSWAGVLPGQEFEKWCLRPLLRIIAGVRLRRPDIPIIVFPRGAHLHLCRIAAEAGANAIGLDSTVDSRWAAATLQSILPVQGNLDPFALVAGGLALEQALDELIQYFSGGPYIFNLGHGIVPETPVAHVELLVHRLRAGR